MTICAKCSKKLFTDDDQSNRVYIAQRSKLVESKGLFYCSLDCFDPTLLLPKDNRSVRH